MKVTETGLPGVLLIEPTIHDDGRGFFLEMFNHERLGAGMSPEIRQVNHSRSTRDVLRGLHFQPRFPQGKLVSVIRGSILDVAVDVRVGSPHFGRWVGMTLEEGTPRHAWIPPGFAHGFCVLSDVADVVYLCTDHVYHGSDDLGIAWSDPEIAIDWPVKEPILSAKDRLLPTLQQARASLPRYQP